MRRSDGEFSQQRFINVAWQVGLGLAIIRQLVELHGGTVRAHSAGEGNGATFTVMLPHLRPRQMTGGLGRAGTASTRPGKLDPAPMLAGVRVRLVEDDPSMLSAVQLLLRKSGAEATGVGSAREALAVFNESLSTNRPFDVLTSDLGMPGMDGYGLIREVRRIERERGFSRGIPAVALSAYAREEDRAKSTVAGFQMHVSKPVEPAELVTMVASLAGRA
ncbi:MAG TPA: response regulator [Tepidisphaeraceae bacterium]|nr:response regulator [Tepidisphaeraceae bacterium]